MSARHRPSVFSTSARVITGRAASAVGLLGSLVLVGGLLLGASPAAAQAPDPNPETLDTTVDCPVGLGSCTANEVQTVVLNAVGVDGDTCMSTADTITVDLVLGLSANNDSYDISVWVAEDGGTLNTKMGNPPTAEDCAGVGATFDPNIVDAVSPFSFTDEDGEVVEGDTCGDMATIDEGTPLQWTVRATVDCVQSEGGEFLAIQGCRIWDQLESREPACTSLASSGTGSKCDCDPLDAPQIPVPTDPCAGVDCSDLDDQCNDGVCNPDTGACEADPKPLSTSCEDGNVCTSEQGVEGTPDHCDGNGQCVGVPVDCSGLDDQCNDGVCDGATGACEAEPKADSTPCEDGDSCTSETGTAGGADHCSGGTCTGIPVDCSAAGDDCNVGVCIPGSGACAPTPVPDSTPCEDGNVCTSETGTEGGADHCSGGVCTGVPVDCTGDDDQCNVGVCNAGTGACEPDPVEDSTPCQDGDVCTSETGTEGGADHCSGGVCTGVPVDCTGDDDQCNVGVCNAGTGACEPDPVEDSTPCQDGDVCTSETGTEGGADHCSGGVCTGVPVDCTGDDDQCNVGVCNAGTGACEPDPVEDSTPCQDGDVCTSETGTEGGADHCSGGVCTGVPVDCTGDDDQCNVGVCNAGTGACEPDPVEDSTPCQDGDVCTSETGTEGGADHCSGGVCTGVPVDCTGDDDQCNVGVCNAGTGACEPDPVEDSTPCQDGDVCTSETGTEGGADHCSGGVCTGVPVDCTGDDDQCNVGVCNAGTGACEPDPVEDSTPCQDGDVCTSETGTEGGADHCSGGVCTGVPVDCTGDDDQCNVGVCNAGTGACEPDPVEDSTPCQDGDVCTSETGVEQTPDHCESGVCTGIPVDCSALDDQCNDGVCDENDGACVPLAKPPGTPCEDDLFCTGVDGGPGNADECTDGVCIGTPVDCNDGFICTDDSCDETKDQCVNDWICNQPSLSITNVGLEFDSTTMLSGDWGISNESEEPGVEAVVSEFDVVVEVRSGRRGRWTTVDATCEFDPAAPVDVPEDDNNSSTAELEGRYMCTLDTALEPGDDVRVTFEASVLGRRKPFALSTTGSF